MEIYPAIDLRDGKVVRLSQGDYDKMEVYSDDPVEVAKGFREKGARNLHLVDLDGAKDGALSNFETIRRIVESAGLFVEVGGGIRDEERIRRYLEIGVSRVILGTVAAEQPEFVREMVGKFGGAVAVGVDARDGLVAVKGWRELTQLDSVAFCRELAGMGVETIIYTDISRDGMMQGVNLGIYDRLRREVECNFIASGGVSAMEDLERLREMQVYGAIIGKALYTGAIDLEAVMGVNS
ncbi:MAG: 1-(5-phosphoribosyl)-5-[(5-phosphoribosylamino)methylideneamino]imidazole-4-carboxamide isomerase [Oscillospiraceae bacterium]